MDKDLTNAANKKYIVIVKEIAQPQFTAKLVEWAQRLTEQHKKGLHVIKFVVDLRGMKRFKKNACEEGLSSSEIFSDVKNMPNAKDVFRKMTNTTQYAKQFGARPKELQDFKVLNKKPFNKLAIAQVLKPNIVAMISRWLGINDQEKFTERIFNTVREMFTVVKNLLADVPTSQDFHANHIDLEAKPPRFDKILL
mmetsp:Transcript_40377/g.52939  ORF Transcript_40377/g.52939 Transcript_40377/m.52939 type:complete len:195 (+) Transcript_40377:258-842(+)